MRYVEKPVQHFSWRDDERCLAGFSTRKGGVSRGVYESMNTGLHSADDRAAVLENRRRFFAAVAPGFTVASLHQVHSAEIVRVDAGFASGVQADGFFTTEAGVLLAVSIADCGSVLLHDDDFTVAAALHCGWRGTRDGIIRNMLDRLAPFAEPRRLSAYVGPMIQQENYEVGREFLDFFPRRFLLEKGRRLFLDLNGCVEEELRAAGVGRVLCAGLDTFSNPDMFFSYRRDGATGRMCSYIGLRR